MIGIMGAMPEETNRLVKNLKNSTKEIHGNRTYHIGDLFGKKVIIVFSRWGKVAAASTAVHLIIHYKVDEILFTGVAGAIDSKLNIGDIVIGNRLFQHDMDARPLLPKYEIPLLSTSHFESDQIKRQIIYRASLAFISTIIRHIPKNELIEYDIVEPKVVVGNIASGDQFVSDEATKRRIAGELPDICCVEMEGAAVAQVCHEYGMPFTIFRIISDLADGNAEIDFPKFVRKIASNYSSGVLYELFTT